MLSIGTPMLKLSNGDYFIRISQRGEIRYENISDKEFNEIFDLQGYNTHKNVGGKK